ncbi:MAG: DUF2789 family protein [Pseudomonadales bacterium]
MMLDEAVTISDLFKQLGLPDSDEEIADFVEQHKPLAEHLAIHEATFWSPSQASFLQESLCEDSAWAVAVDDLSTRLRA